MEKRALIAIVVSMVILFAWQYYFSPKTPQQATQTQGANTHTAQTQKQAGETRTASGGPAETEQLAPSAMPQTPVPLKTPAQLVTVDTSKMRVTLGDLGGGVISVRLKEYKETLGGVRARSLCRISRPISISPWSRR